jgi:hypothetical protein
MCRLIGLNGYAQVGKDTAAQGLVAEGWERVGFADALKDLARRIDPLVRMATGYALDSLVEEEGWDKAKQNPDVRRLLQNIGTGVRNVVGATTWVEIAARRIRESMALGVVTTDTRFPEEVAMIRAYGGKIIRITRPGVGPVNGHCSETAIDDIEPDYVIVNDSTPEELQSKLVNYASDLALGVGC